MHQIVNVPDVIKLKKIKLFTLLSLLRKLQQNTFLLLFDCSLL